MNTQLKGISTAEVAGISRLMGLSTARLSPAASSRATGARNMTPSDEESVKMAERAEHLAKLAKVQPLNNRVLVRRIEEEDDKQVQVADAYKPKSNRGQVLAVGHRVVSVKRGDTVMFGEYSAQDISIDGEELVLLSLEDIWVKL